jgi:hypothetical protein
MSKIQATTLIPSPDPEKALVPCDTCKERTDPTVSLLSVDGMPRLVSDDVDEFSLRLAPSIWGRLGETVSTEIYGYKSNLVKFKFALKSKI